MNKFGIIYKSENKINGYIYIGQTTHSLNIRISGHFSAAMSGKKKNNYFQNALLKYGKDNFKWEILENNIPAAALDDRERFYIKKFDSMKNGYNSTEGGDFQPFKCIFSDKVRKKMSESQRGRIISDSTRKKMSESAKGKIVSEKTKNKMSESKKKLYKKRRHHLTGHSFSDSTRKKMSESQKGKVLKEETKEKLRQYNLGKKHKEESKKKMSLARMGENNVSKRPEVRKKLSERQIGEKNHRWGIKYSEEEKYKFGLLQLKRGLPSNNTSGFKGVSAYNKSGKWRAKCDRHIIGIFDCKIDAAKAYDDYITNEYGKENVVTNKDLCLI